MLLALERLGELPRLGASRRVERGIGVTLTTALAVPVRLAVAGEEDSRHRAVR